LRKIVGSAKEVGELDYFDIGPSKPISSCFESDDEI